MKTRFKFLVQMAVAGVIALSGSLALAECDVTKVVEVSMERMRFVPAHVEICEGQTVRWTNNDPANAPRPSRHTVTTNPELARDRNHASAPVGAEVFDSGLIAPGESFEYTFSVVGDYKYFCRPHEMMGHLGTLKVVAAE